MRRRMLVLLMAAVWLAVGCGSAVAAEAPKVVTLPNGLTLITQEDNRFPLVSMRLFVHAGSGYETPKQAGLSHLLEHMVFKSTVKRPAGQVASDVESAGGAINASTSFDATIFKVDLPAERWKLGLDVLQDMIFGAKFDPKELESERKVVLSELYRGRDDPNSRLFQTLQPLIWPGTSYSWPVIGFPKTVSAFTSDDLRAYVAAHYQPSAMVLVVVGKVPPAEVLHQVETLFGGLKNDRSRRLVEPFVQPGTTAGPTVKVEYGQWNKVRLQVAFPCPGLRSAEEAPLEVLANLLGGDETGRLYRTFKYEKKLVDDIACTAMTLQRGGVFMITATLDAKNMTAFWQGLVTELSRLSAKTFTDREIARSQLSIEDGLYRTKESLSGLASKIGYFHFYGYDPDGEANAVKAVRLVDRSALQAVINATLRPDRLVAALLVPTADQSLLSAKSLTEAVTRLWPAQAKTAETKAGSGSAAAPEVVDLGGGHTFVLLPDGTLPYVAVSLAMRGGDGLLASNRQGLAELTSDCLTNSTAKLTATALDDYLADRAAAVTGASGRDGFFVSAKFPSRFQKDLYGVLADMLETPAFRKEEVARSVHDQLADIKVKEDRPMGLALRHLFPFLYADTTYAYQRLGDPKVVARFTQQDVKAFWAKQRAMPWVLAVCGDFDAAQVRQLAQSLAKAVASRPFEYATPKWGERHAEKVTLAGRNQTHLLMVFPVPGVESADTPALELLNEALAGQSGLLFSRLREAESLGYVVTSFLWQTAKTGFLTFYIGTSPDKAPAALDGFKRVAADIRAMDLPDELLLRAKNAMSGDYYRDRQGLGARSGEAARSLVRGLPLDHDRQVVEAAQKVSADTLRQVAAKYLLPEKAYVLTVAP